MRKKFCPKCGKEVDQLYRNLCENCILSKISITDKIPNKTVIGRCKICSKVYAADKGFNSVESAVGSALSKVLKQKEIKDANYRIENNKIHLSMILEVEGLEKQEEKNINLIVKSITCNQCSMKSIGYYQSIIQIRAPERLLDPIQKEIEKQISSFKSDRLAFISKTQQVKNGLDLYLGSKQVANQIAKRLKEKFKANIKISRKLSGVISGKTVSRDTILVSIGE
jgi:nonsense-mediated mRNA decay protein 3